MLCVRREYIKTSFVSAQHPTQGSSEDGNLDLIDDAFNIYRCHLGLSPHLSSPDKVDKYVGQQQTKFAFIPTKQIVSDDKASGKSMSPAASTSEFGHESFTKIMEVLRVAICWRGEKFVRHEKRQ